MGSGGGAGMTPSAEDKAACGHERAWHAEPAAALFLGDAVSVLAGLPENSVDNYKGIRKNLGSLAVLCSRMRWQETHKARRFRERFANFSSANEAKGLI